ncbi:hypothetical protein KSS87_001571 [Heliosperma pusillum]|nr:hypothetical protein KSS87_001571 [Heliosperma pusillum]KAH9614214.1 hypothetical protein KSS87_001571 [Heliosperma pusillum]KAH9614217.1 hypothetical protein KSS87_001571 [Heliosperma pusillum]
MQTMGNEARKTHCSHKELQCKHWVMKLGRLIVHTRSYNVTMGNEARKTHCSHKELQCKQWVMKQGSLIVHTRSYDANNW